MKKVPVVKITTPHAAADLAGCRWRQRLGWPMWPRR